jgi:hypothetical protein
MATYKTIEEIEPGLLLAEPVVNNFGQTMIPVGAELQEKHLRLLKTWNVAGVMVKGDGEDEEIEISPQMIEIAIKKLESSMKWKCELTIELDLFDSAVKHIAKHDS